MGERRGQRKTNIKAANVAISTLNPINHSSRAIMKNTRNPTKYLHIKLRDEYKKNYILVIVNNSQKKKIAYQARLKLKEPSKSSSSSLTPLSFDIYSIINNNKNHPIFSSLKKNKKNKEE
jgi:hypothetical protein